MLGAGRTVGFCKSIFSSSSITTTRSRGQNRTQGEFVGSYREVETLEDREGAGGPHRVSDCSQYKHPRDLYVGIRFFSACESDNGVSRRKRGTGQVHRRTKSGVTASDPSGKYRLNLHGRVKAWVNFWVPSEQTTGSGICQNWNLLKYFRFDTRRGVGRVGGWGGIEVRGKSLGIGTEPQTRGWRTIVTIRCTTLHTSERR